MGSPGRREIGHGALGERALKQVLTFNGRIPLYDSYCSGCNGK